MTTTPRNTKLLRDLTSRTDGSVHITRGRIWGNEFLDEGMAEDLRREYMGTRLGRQELEGEMLGDFEGALISRDDLDKHRIPRESIPLLSRVVVGVDPAMKAGEDHDESGIIVAGEGTGPDGELHAYSSTPVSAASRSISWSWKAGSRACDAGACRCRWYQ